MQMIVIIRALWMVDFNICFAKRFIEHLGRIVDRMRSSYFFQIEINTRNTTLRLHVSLPQLLLQYLDKEFDSEFSPHEAIDSVNYLCTQIRFIWLNECLLDCMHPILGISFL